MKLKFYPYSKGDTSVGISGWSEEVVINTPSDEPPTKEEVEYYRQTIKEMYETYDCDGVETELELAEIDEYETEDFVQWAEENDKRKLKKAVRMLEEVRNKIEELNKTWRQRR